MVPYYLKNKFAQEFPYKSAESSNKRHGDNVWLARIMSVGQRLGNVKYVKNKLSVVFVSSLLSPVAQLLTYRT